jgi:hypothetical protein
MLFVQTFATNVFEPQVNIRQVSHSDLSFLKKEPPRGSATAARIRAV